MGDAEARIYRGFEALQRAIQDARRAKAASSRLIERSLTLMDQAAGLLDRGAEQAASLRAGRLSWITTGETERDRVRLCAEDADALEQAMAHKIERRGAEGWVVATIEYPAEWMNFGVVIGFERRSPDDGSKTNA